VFRFTFTATLPGRVSQTNAVSAPGFPSPGTRIWELPLGKVSDVLLETEGWRRSSIRSVVISGAAGAVVVLGLLVWLLRRWRARRRRNKAAKIGPVAGGTGATGTGEAVTPAS
jgi:hypothetical protein